MRGRRGDGEREREGRCCLLAFFFHAHTPRFFIAHDTRPAMALASCRPTPSLASSATRCGLAWVMEERKRAQSRVWGEASKARPACKSSQHVWPLACGPATAHSLSLSHACPSRPPTQTHRSLLPSAGGVSPRLLARCVARAKGGDVGIPRSRQGGGNPAARLPTLSQNHPTLFVTAAAPATPPPPPPPTRNPRTRSALPKSTAWRRGCGRC